jgi:tetratricopeptide (TPR) repeat protein
VISSASLTHLQSRSTLRLRDRALALVLAGALGSSLLLGPTAGAAEPPPAATSVGATSFPRARELFFKGVAEQSAGNWARALDFFQQSLLEAPTWQSTMNAAFCLGKLARYDEALTTYERLLTSFAAQIDPTERARVDAAMAYLQQKVASLEITTGVVAAITIDGAPRGETPRGAPLVLRVTADTHRIQIVKAGFKPVDRTMAFAPGATVILVAELEKVPLPPSPSPSLPSPPPDPRQRQSLSAFAGGVIAGSLGSTAERRESSIRRAPVGGFLAGIRGDYSFPIGLSLELTLGYLYAVSGLRRDVDNPSFVDPSPGESFPLTYDLQDTLTVRGPFLGAGASYRLALDDRLSFLARSTFGIFEARSSDPVIGRVCAGSGCAPKDGVDVIVNGNSQILSSTSGFLLPELGVDARWGDLHAELSLGLFLLTADGPSFKGRQAGVDPKACTPAAPAGSVACAPNRPLGEDDPSSTLSHATHELAYGRFAMIWVPRVAVGYSF